MGPFWVNKLIFFHNFYNFHMSFHFGKSKKLVFVKFSLNELFDKLSEPSRAELFDQKLEPKTELSEPSLGSGATLLDTYIVLLLSTAYYTQH